MLTGPTGFLGSAFLKHAVAAGHDVLAMIRPRPAADAFLRSTRITWVAGTMAAPPWDEIDGFRPDVCVHTAWVTQPGVYLQSPDNVRHRDWSLALAEHLMPRGLRQFVGVGTCTEYADTGRPLDEGSPIRPLSLYARCKTESRLGLEERAKRHTVAACWARLFHPYGIGEHPARLCTAVIQALAAGESITLRTPDSIKDYVHIEDVAAALLHLVEVRCGETVNVGTGIGTTVEAIACDLGRIMNKPGLVRRASQSDPDPHAHQVADPSKLHRLGWRPKIALHDGLADLVARLTA